ncbi:Glyoxylase, beta-lactamase superfamily II [Alkalithermobacter thermoalcaliphilus JW-YL-7 = DSM 7308]|uniref:Beta-lactamase domain protein n=1 Tax=Alkalithermobacter thermoalcaliphilus JW-YL-7 = DSM 7308 TaxID=1121328 RepID=A0A150FP53_CLOPD|nr:beta-lactamase domain protein [[Clostridium] paradoxum JW-YL-7 = DSM 7308]SHK51823.1 Glyoxylase, beta-lactamase superfamily II [[Clostridium] paradoxum JW-YL-7 = DSM 7308]
MKIKNIVCGIYGVNCYIIADEETKKCAVIDPGGNHEEIINYIDENGFDLEFIILTHGHADHIGAVGELKDIKDCKVVACKDEKYILNNKDFNLTSVIGSKELEIEADEYVKDQDNLCLGRLSLQIIHTPGHTPGSICIKVENILFSGDTLFSGSIGRTDLEGGSYEKIIHSLEKLIQLDDEVVVMPGHGPSTTIGREKRTNRFIIDR